MAWAGWASVGAALVVVGVILGAALSSSSAPSSSNSTSRQTSGSVPVPLVPPAAPDTVCGTTAANGRGPALCLMNQSLGTANAPWVVLGHGFVPSSSVTVSLTWQSPPQVTPNQSSRHTARVKPVVGRDGTLPAEHQPALPRPAAAWTVRRRGDRTGPQRAHHDVLVVPSGV